MCKIKKEHLRTVLFLGVNLKHLSRPYEGVLKSVQYTVCRFIKKVIKNKRAASKS